MAEKIKGKIKNWIIDRKRKLSDLATYVTKNVRKESTSHEEKPTEQDYVNSMHKFLE